MSNTTSRLILTKHGRVLMSTSFPFKAFNFAKILQKLSLLGMLAFLFGIIDYHQLDFAEAILTCMQFVFLPLHSCALQAYGIPLAAPGSMAPQPATSGEEGSDS